MPEAQISYRNSVQFELTEFQTPSQNRMFLFSKRSNVLVFDKRSNLLTSVDITEEMLPAFNSVETIRLPCKHGTLYDEMQTEVHSKK